ncbi:MAG: transporter substrate-binding domain-containing protein [Draconibacterium sp.]
MDTKTYVLLFAIIVNFLACTDDAITENKTELKFISEEYAPFNYSNNGVSSGLSADLLQNICQQLDIKCNIEFSLWDDAYNTALNNENAVLFSTALNSQRRDLFKWAGPIASLDWSFYASSNSSLVLTDLDAAKTVNKIGVITEYAMEEYLLDEGFTNLSYCEDLSDAFSKLLNGEIDLFASDIYTTKDALEKLGESEYAVKSLLTIKTDLLYFAFNKAVSDDVVEQFQSAIKTCKDNGVLRRLSQQYLHTAEYPGKLQLYTESYKPLTYSDKYGEITGYGTDIVKEIMQRNAVYEPIKLSTWTNGYQLALNNPDFCLFTMDRTELRENLFQWVGPIGTNATYFYTKAGSGISINSLDDARALTAVGVINSWFSGQYLSKQEFPNLVYESDPAVMVQRLMDGEVDAFVCTDVTFPEIVAASGFSYNQTTPEFKLMASDFYIAFSNYTPASTVVQWQNALDQMKSDGTYNAILSRWFPNK